MQPDPTQAGNSRPPVVRVFIGAYGLRSGWGLTLFLLLSAVIAMVPQYFARRSPFGVWSLGVLAATWIMARLDHQPFTSYGLGAVDRGRNLLAGLAAGFVALSLLMGLLVATRAFDPRGPDLHGVASARWALYWMAVFTFTALGEELLMRGYGLFALSQGIGYWPAAVVLSLLFGAGHIGNRGEEIIGIANAVLAGMLFAFSVWWSGTLWWAIGCHLTWDWAETFFYGVPNSGGPVVSTHFLTGAPAGPAWLSGGTVGPEGSVLATVVLVLLAAAVRYTTPRHAVAGLERRLGHSRLTASEAHPS